MRATQKSTVESQKLVRRAILKALADGPLTQRQLIDQLAGEITAGRVRSGIQRLVAVGAVNGIENRGGRIYETWEDTMRRVREVGGTERSLRCRQPGPARRVA